MFIKKREKKNGKKERRKIPTTEINVKRMLFSTSMKSSVGVRNFREKKAACSQSIKKRCGHTGEPVFP